MQKHNEWEHSMLLIISEAPSSDIAGCFYFACGCYGVPLLPCGGTCVCPVWGRVRREAHDMSSRSGRWPVIRRMAWDRDRKARAVCHICGQPIDYYLEPSSAPNSWEPDHLIPVAKRPDLELDLMNIAASHMRCNRVRGDGTNGENTLGMRSRIW